MCLTGLVVGQCLLFIHTAVSITHLVRQKVFVDLGDMVMIGFGRMKIVFLAIGGVGFRVSYLPT